MRRHVLPSPYAAALLVSLGVVATVLFLAPPLRELTRAQVGPAEASAATSAAPATVEVMHFWNSDSERDALAAIRNAYVASGGEWIDSAQPDQRSLRRTLMDRFSTSTPPSAVLWQSNVELRDLAEVGLFSDLDAAAAAGGWDEALAPAIRSRVQVDGHYYMAPINIHANNWVFYSAPMLRRLDIDQPESWAQMLAAMRRIEADGGRAVAIGAGEWEATTAFVSMMVGTLGRDDYRALISRRDASVLRKPAALEMYRVFAEFRRIARRYEPYADWVQAARAVARGEAGFEFMGDWAKAEFTRRGAAPGRDFGCMLAPGSENALVLTIDGFAFPVGASPARHALAAVMMEPDVQRRFALHKGTLAARADAPPTSPDSCERITIERMRDPAAAVEPPNSGLPAAMAGDFEVAVSRFYNDTSITPEQGLAELVAVFSR